MRSCILLFILSGYMQGVTAQTRVRQIKIPEPKGDATCTYKPKYSAEKLSQFYPFSIADTIKLVSFRYHWNNYPIEADKVIYDSLIEVKTLTKVQIDKLTDILYNNFYKQQPNYGSVAECFSPRNAILFVNKAGQLKACILLCFHCNRYKKSSDKVNFGDECIQKTEQLRQFFVDEGLHFGTDLLVESYAGESDIPDTVYPPVQQ